MGISFNTTAFEQLRLRNGCFALSAIAAPRAAMTDRWGYMTQDSDSSTPWEKLAELLKWSPPFSEH